MVLNDIQTEPVWDSNNNLLYLPPVAEGWDVQLNGSNNSKGVIYLIRAGLYKWEFDPPTRVRPLRTAEWRSFHRTALEATNERVVTIKVPESPKEVPYVTSTVPYSNFLAGEKLELVFLPAKQGHFEVQIAGEQTKFTVVLDRNCWMIKDGLPAGKYKIRVRWVPSLGDSDVQQWSGWSRKFVVTYHSAENKSEVKRLQIIEHRLSLMYEKDLNGVSIITDPWALPPSCPEKEPVQWFRTPCYEGVTMLINEESDYYRDPLNYYLSCIQQLKDRGVAFLTWHDLLDGKVGRTENEVLIQFDVDGGPISMERLYNKLSSLGIRATIMIHRECYDWYEYTIDDLARKGWLQEAEKRGWAIGYHNNSLTNAQRLHKLGDYGPDVLSEAKNRFRDDVRHLRQWFNIRIFTNHGGNVLNKLTPVPEDLDIVCVDKGFNRPLWNLIEGSFSDGGFMSRPCSLREKVNNLKPGLHFFRNHPVKYANYLPPFDVPPLRIEEFERFGIKATRMVTDWIECETRKENLWLEMRKKHRLGRRLTYASHVKPISQKFRPFSEIQELAEAFRSRRKRYWRVYPWTQGDPRVFWWRFLDAYAPKEGKLLNVGALPPEKRDETTSFVGPGVQVFEMDIDPNRKPHILCDITIPPRDLYGTFSGILFHGLTVIHSPSKAVEACAKLARSGGVGLFAFRASTDPSRGGLWQPFTRPVWRKDREPLLNIGLRGFLWSFDQECLSDLLSPWWDIVSVEFFSHMWFVYCIKK